MLNLPTSRPAMTLKKPQSIALFVAATACIATGGYILFTTFDLALNHVGLGLAIGGIIVAIVGLFLLPVTPDD